LPKGIRLIVRQERSHPGAQLRFTDIGGHRVTFFATSTKSGQFALVLVQAAHQPRGALPQCGTNPRIHSGAHSPTSHPPAGRGSGIAVPSDVAAMRLISLFA